MGSGKLLTEYHKKRDFKLSSEPFGGDSDLEDKEKKIFVIQKHDASNLHYDFRLLVDGVLKSWAVPKGPSTDPREKRLAIPTEDHPIEYADFEGIIPEDQYGGGTVMVWDASTYENEKTDKKGAEISMQEQLDKGRCTFILHEKKLRGGYSLIKFGKGKDENWMLRKVDDDEADARRNPVNTETKSVLTGRSMAQIRKESITDEEGSRNHI
ncbi:DNA ligase [Antarcticibacterium sp. 1MA-6-2]|uniref:DNA polymerase ligase N-terminal domain-containing protein n=1 Tax=Antarcticibacterium sp. 1MA-6-2 TaxID=2908210 RepID=UPI001F31F7D5|nr:DNA polymerase ligase N-terminal domain-containing protein [Antarcticibacterium sp. 1MA-6-2]UJH90428.1 DNA ligase [Antarcticibacterium sp. 1MA-6-2]